MITTSFDRLEMTYDAVADAVDRVGPEQEALFLAKLVLTLANRLDNSSEVIACIEIALRDFEPCGQRNDGPGAVPDPSLLP